MVAGPVASASARESALSRLRYPGSCHVEARAAGWTLRPSAANCQPPGSRGAAPVRLDLAVTGAPQARSTARPDPRGPTVALATGLHSLAPPLQGRKDTPRSAELPKALPQLPPAAPRACRARYIARSQLNSGWPWPWLGSRHRAAWLPILRLVLYFGFDAFPLLLFSLLCLSCLLLITYAVSPFYFLFLPFCLSLPPSFPPPSRFGGRPSHPFSATSNLLSECQALLSARF